MDGHWILLGMMGVGKSTVGRRLAEHLQLPFVDTDKVLEHKLGRGVSQAFAIYGEEAFRGHETTVLKELERAPGVLSTGGGIILREQNWQEFKRLGTTIYLDAPPELLIERLMISKKKRPLLQVENWEERFMQLYEARLPLYRKANLSLQICSGEITKVVDDLCQLVGAQP